VPTMRNANRVLRWPVLPAMTVCLLLGGSALLTAGCQEQPERTPKPPETANPSGEKPPDARAKPAARKDDKAGAAGTPDKTDNGKTEADKRKDAEAAAARGAGATRRSFAPTATELIWMGIVLALGLSVVGIFGFLRYRREALLRARPADEGARDRQETLDRLNPSDEYALTPAPDERHFRDSRVDASAGPVERRGAERPEAAPVPPPIANAQLVEIRNQLAHIAPLRQEQSRLAALVEAQKQEIDDLRAELAVLTQQAEMSNGLLNELEVRTSRRVDELARSGDQRSIALDGRLGPLEARALDLDKRTLDVEQKVKELRMTNITRYFDNWRDNSLKAQQAKESERIFAEFANQPERRQALIEHHQAQTRLAEKATQLLDPLVDWVGRAGGSGELSPSLSPALGRFRSYVERGAALIRDLGASLDKFDLRQIAPEAGPELTFFDVVSGRSASIISHGYLDRLTKRVTELTDATPTLTQRWDRLRGELLELLDEFYASLDALEPRVQARAELDAGLRGALASAKIQEIPVDPNRTAYDPALHESLASRPAARTSPSDNTISALQRRGYFHEGKVLRRAIVTLSGQAG
jgi:hypothetical protein